MDTTKLVPYSVLKEERVLNYVLDTSSDRLRVKVGRAIAD
jgi:small-conductance mechanosensitive channel